MSISGLILLYKEELIGSSLSSKHIKQDMDLWLLKQRIELTKEIKSISFYKMHNYYVFNFDNKPSVYYHGSQNREIGNFVIKVLEKISYFHRTLFLHPYCVMYFGISLLFLIISGMILVQKASLKKVLKKKKSFLHVHIMLGTLFSPLLLVYILSGIILPINTIIQKTFFSKNLLYPYNYMHNEDKKTDFIKLYYFVFHEINGGTITRIYFPNEKNKTFVFRIKYADELHPNGKSYMSIDTYNYKILQNIDARKHPFWVHFFQNIYTFHIGKIGVNINFIVVFSVALILLALVLFAYLKYQVRNKR